MGTGEMGTGIVQDPVDGRGTGALGTWLGTLWDPGDGEDMGTLGHGDMGDGDMETVRVGTGTVQDPADGGDLEHLRHGDGAVPGPWLWKGHGERGDGVRDSPGPCR